MKQIIYQGSNKKYVMLTFNYLNDTPWDETKNEDRILLSNILVHNMNAIDYNIDNVINNLHIYHVETKEVVIDEVIHFFHTDVLVISCLDEKMARTTMDILNRNRIMSLCAGDIIRSKYWDTQHEMVTPYFLSYKARFETGTIAQTTIFPTNSTRSSNKYKNWYNYYTDTRSPYEQKVIGYSTLNKKLNINTWNDFLNPYGAKPKLDIIISIYDNYADAINDEDGMWLLSYGLYNKAPDYYRSSPKMKLYAEIHEKTLIVTDNISGYNSIKNELLHSENIFMNIDVITINQYNLKDRNGDLIICSNMTNYINRWLKLLLVNKNKILGMKYSYDDYSYSYNIKVGYAINDNKKTDLYTKLQASRRNTILSYIVPFVQDESSHINSIKLLNQFLSFDRDEQPGIIQEYISSCLTKDNGIEEDVLTKWFKNATLNASEDQDKLKNAYIKLKDNLINEYYNVKIYMEATKLTDKQPIPSVRLDKILSTNPSKIISFNWSNHRLQNVEHYRLDTPIDYTTLDVSYYYRKGKGPQAMIYNGRCECKNLVDKTKNELYLNLNNIIKIDLENRKRER